MIIIKTPAEIKLMRVSGKHLARILDLLVQKVKIGVGTEYLNDLAEAEIKKIGADPVFKGYGGFPTAICSSLNEEVVHAPAIPNRVLKEGDILSIDIGLRFPAKTGMVSDMATTVPVGKIPDATKKLLEVTRKSLNLAIKKVRAGVQLGDVSYEIQNFVEKNGFNVVRDLVGHGVGRELHEPPQIFNYGKKKTGPVLKSGMILAFEPMVSVGSSEIVQDKITGAFKTADNSLSAHFEHSVLVTEKEAEIMTRLS